MQKIVTIVRGLPGSGKSSYALSLYHGLQFRGMETGLCSADDFFTDADGNYNFDPSKLGEAHADCQRRSELLLQVDMNVIVANTFTARWEMQPYLLLAEKHRARVVVVDLFDGGMDDATLAEKNIHGVPLQTIALMRGRWEHNWREGNPVAPWLRERQ